MVTVTDEPGASALPALGSVPINLSAGPNAGRVLPFGQRDNRTSAAVLSAATGVMPSVSGTSPETESITVTVDPCGTWPAGGVCPTIVPLFVLCSA